MSEKTKNEIKVGSVVEWVGQANGGATAHEGVVKGFETNGRGERLATVLVGGGPNKRTGKPTKGKTYTPRVSSLKLSK